MPVGLVLPGPSRRHLKHKSSTISRTVKRESVVNSFSCERFDRYTPFHDMRAEVKRAVEEKMQMELEDINSSVARKIRCYLEEISPPRGIVDGSRIDNVFKTIHISPPPPALEQRERIAQESREKIDKKSKEIEQMKKQLEELRYRERHCKVALDPESADGDAILEKERELEATYRMVRERELMRKEEFISTSSRNFEKIITMRCRIQVDIPAMFEGKENVMKEQIVETRAMIVRLKKLFSSLQSALKATKARQVTGTESPRGSNVAPVRVTPANRPQVASYKQTTPGNQKMPTSRLATNSTIAAKQ